MVYAEETVKSNETQPQIVETISAETPVEASTTETAKTETEPTYPEFMKYGIKPREARYYEPSSS